MFLDNLLMLFAGSREQRKQQKQMEEQILNSDEYLRKQMYRDMHYIKGWVKFWSWLGVIALVIIIIQMCSTSLPL